MNREQTKRLVTDYLDRMARGDVAGALALTTDDAQFWMPGSGDMDRATFSQFFSQVVPLVQSMKFSFEAWTIDGDRVALEARGDAVLKNQRPYHNRYHFLFIVNEGRISVVREYADTAPAAVFIE